MRNLQDIEPILGYIGASFLILRFLPIVAEQIKTPQKINTRFLILEAMSCIFLGSSAIILKAYPFIMANAISLINVLIIAIIQLINKKKTKIIQNSTMIIRNNNQEQTHTEVCLK